VIRGIVFDLFDTLVHHETERLAFREHEGRRLSPSTPRLHEHAVRVAGLELSLSEFAAIQREVDEALHEETIARGLELPTIRRFGALAARLGRGDDAELAAAWTDIHMTLLRSAVRIPGHHEAILAALAVDHRLAVCSNFSHGRTARAILEEARFDAHLAGIVISEELGFRKPRPEVFAAVAESLELSPGEILHVGDDLAADVAGAAAAGLRTVWLTRRVRDPEGELAAYDGPRPDFALEDLLDLPVLAARLGRAGSSD
jgi:FMN phosphatase YigB (HAD superfamily)